jgi:glycosyltransferase involved in cell wall biosynthesis
MCVGEGSGRRVAHDQDALAADRAVSVIVPCYNAVETLRATLDSLRSQTLSDWEALCVDDGSADRTPDLLEAAAAADPRVRWMRGEHRGPGAARNAGLRAARGRRVVFLDADDIAHPDALTVLSNASEEAGDNTIVTAGYELLTQSGEGLSLLRFPSAPAFSVDALLRGNPIPPMTMVPRALLSESPFDESGSLRGCEDWDLWLRLAHGGTMCVTLPRVLFGYRLHSRSLSHDADRMYASSRGILDKWMRFALAPEALRDVPHLIACNCGALALAGGSADAIGRYFEPLGPLIPTDGFFAAAASGVRDAFQFVHGAAGRTWADHADEWLERIETWLKDGPLAPYADAISGRLRAFSADPDEGVAAVRKLLRDRPDARQLVIYGLGTNGLTLLHRLGRDRPTELRVADDHASPLAVRALGLPRDDPRRWGEWPGAAVAVVTPNDFAAMRRTLLDAGGREGTDFITLNGPAVASARMGA